MGYNSVVSGHQKPTGIQWVDGLSTGPPNLGCHSLVSELRYTNTQDSVGTGLDHASIMHFDELMCDILHDIVLYVV